jgi:type II secretory pathway pseudopilin PulG
MNTVLIGAGIVLVLAVIGGLVMLYRRGRQAGEATTRVEVQRGAIDAQDRVARAQAEPRGPEVTQRKLDDGTL